MQKKLSHKIYTVIFLLVLFLADSCVSVRKVSYLNDINKIQETAVNPREQKLISPFDKLFIIIYSIDENTNRLFNSGDNSSVSSIPGAIGYLVNEAGEIDYPYVGKLHVAGLSLQQASLKLEEALKNYVSKTTIASIKYIDNNVTVMGEVQKQGVFSFTRDNLNIYEALALGGGLTRYGDRKNIILIRQEEDKVVYNKLNLSNSKITSSNYYYILPNDVIIVEPMRVISSTYGGSTISIILSSISTIVTILLFTGVSF